MHIPVVAEVPFTDAEVKALREDGYVLIRGALPDSALQPLRDALADVVDLMARQWQREGLLTELHEDLPFETRWLHVRRQVPATRPVTWRRVLVSEAMYRLWQRPELTGRMRTVLGDELWAHDTWNGRPREPHATVQRIHWHQDAYYLRGWEPADGHILTCWIPLVPVDAGSGCLQIVPRSHRAGRLPQEFDEFRNRNVATDHLDVAAPVTVPAQVGDVLVFTESTVHRALDNVSDYVRWSVDIRFGADGPAMRRKAKGGYLCRTAGDGGAMDSYAVWAAKYDPRSGAMGQQLRALDAAAARSGAMARDMTTY
jgi:phytanoyl-CoA hydroxylase